MKMLILTSRLDYAAELAIHKLSTLKHIKIIGVLKEKFSFSKMQNLRKIFRLFEGMGFLYATLFLSNFIILKIGIILTVLLYLIGKRKKWKSLAHLCKEKNIPIYKTKNINDKKTQTFLKKLRADYFISINFGQKLERETLDIPQIGSINIHPGLLPKYKGVLPYFWSVLKGEKHTGVTVHYMNERFDEGPVIAQQKIKIKKIDSVFKIFIKTAKTGSSLIKNILLNIKERQTIKSAANKIKGQYYRLPSKTDLQELFEKKKQLFRFKDLKSTIYK